MTAKTGTCQLLSLSRQQLSPQARQHLPRVIFASSFRRWQSNESSSSPNRTRSSAGTSSDKTRSSSGSSIRKDPLANMESLAQDVRTANRQASPFVPQRSSTGTSSSTAASSRPMFANLFDTRRQARNAISRNWVRTPGAADSPSLKSQPAPYQSLIWGSYYNPSTFEHAPGEEQFQRRRRAPPLLGPGRKEAEAQDILHKLRLNPGKPSLADDSYKNGALLTSYISEMGKIFSRAESGLTRKSQRNVGKAVRRARAMGILPAMARGGGRGAGVGWREN
ncbi:hypothetical protein K437DRAFT_107254 [Tilletiaria anomala UBC 951]|uniref:Small ribosomal subunit protein bS18m n=1 Tax=Tilletiaria anomala (strain ATCC 24038 / CBS 436.72 / UBC 951) TaxID=1037660 RepID=A0A066VYA3_TILAU|nr:uncharacterized protein K437DRAFT_107254 [Tilletiaria anomala UBC 951]KDN46446.1 hypothetical protein K437DRAFT_107254 [Tilletiaria anomala UBC 951]